MWPDQDIPRMGVAVHKTKFCDELEELFAKHDALKIIAEKASATVFIA
jgi:hypothetical protein